MTAYVPILVMLIGLLLYLLGNAKTSELGRILFFCGALVLTFSFAGKTVGLLR